MGIESIDVAAGAVVHEEVQGEGPAPQKTAEEFAGSMVVAYHGGPLDLANASSGQGMDLTAIFAGLFKAGQCGPGAQQANHFDLGAILGDVLQFALGLLGAPQGQQKGSCDGSASARGGAPIGAGAPGSSGHQASAPNAGRWPPPTPHAAGSLAPAIDVLPPSGPMDAAEQAGAEALASLNNTDIPADISVGEVKSVGVNGEETCGPLNLSGSASASAGATARAGATSSLDGNGFTATAGAEAVAKVGVEASGAITSEVGSIAGHASADAEAYARAKGMIHVSTKGAEAAAVAEAGAKVEAEADAHAELLGGLVKGSAVGFAESGTGASASGDVALCYDPLEAAVDGTAGAFAGARSGFTAKAGVAGASYSVTAEAWSGAGAKAEFKAGLKDHKFTFSMGVGVAVGVGAFLKVGFEIDTRDLGHALGSIFGAVANLVGGVVGGVLHSAGGVVDGAFGAVAGTFKGSKGDASHADTVVTNFFDNLMSKFMSNPIISEAST